MLTSPTLSLPAHVPESLVREFPYGFGLTTEMDPFGEMVAKVHEGPDIFYAPHAYMGGTPAWVVRRAQDLRDIYFDTEHFSNKDYTPFAKLIDETWSSLPTESDPPAHGKHRAFINKVFTPKAVAKLEDNIRAAAIQYIQAFKNGGKCEFVADFASEFPVKVFTRLMGLPVERTEDFLKWEIGLLRSQNLAEIAEATRNVVSYLRGEIEDRRRHPRDDLFSYVAGGNIDGAALTEDELVGFTFNLFIAGLDTVSANMSLHFHHLATHPDDQSRLREQPEMINDAIDELMRAYAAVTTFRTCKKETTIRGVTMMPGDKVVMCTTLAGRDPEEYLDVDQVILDRKPRHISFGFGPHLCVGMHLARREMRIAMEEFLRLIPDFRVAPGHVVKYHLGVVQPVELPLVWQINRG